MDKKNRYIRWFEDLGSDDVASVGGKNASLGEMIASLRSEGIRVPGGFATTAAAYREFLEANHLDDKIRKELDRFKSGKSDVERAGRGIRKLFRRSRFLEQIAALVAVNEGVLDDLP